MKYEQARSRAVGYCNHEGGYWQPIRPRNWSPPILCLPDGRVFDALLIRRGISPVRKDSTRDRKRRKRMMRSWKFRAQLHREYRGTVRL